MNKNRTHIKKNTVEPNNLLRQLSFQCVILYYRNADNEFIPFSFRLSIKIRDGRLVLNGLLIKKKKKKFYKASIWLLTKIYLNHKQL